MASDFVQNWLATTPGFATPYLLAALGLMINERAGVLNLGCEGMMLVGAMTAAVVSFHTGLAGAGVPVAMLAATFRGSARSSSSRTSWSMPPPRSPWPCGGASTAPMSAFVSAPWARTPQPPTLQA